MSDQSVLKLHQIFCDIGICEDSVLGSERLEELAAPSELKDLLKLSKEWHLQRDHYNVFGVNLFDKDSVWIDKEQIIGDAELVEQWREEHESPNCAEEGWQCFAVFSEYDFIFVNTNPGEMVCSLLQSRTSLAGESFGATRHMVNNCWEDSSLTSAPFSNFLAGLIKFTGAVSEKKTKRLQAASEDVSDDEDEEELQLLHFYHQT